ncbi:MAG: hypothetical protein KC486_27235, partial [Myxococcales bacterium]|nr:hypothetical protein [Myxococcales bacterium]
MITTGLLFASSLLLGIGPAPSASRGYAGPATIEGAEDAPDGTQGASASASSSTASSSSDAPGDAEVDDGELSLDDVFGEGDAAPEETGPASTPASGEGESLEGGEIDSLDDVFGDGGDSSDGGDTIDSLNAASDGGTITSTSAPPSGLFSRDKFTFRARILSSLYYDIARTDRPGTIGRNENRLEFYFSYTPNKHIQIVGDIEPV